MILLPRWSMAGVLPELTYRAAVEQFGAHGAARTVLSHRLVLHGLGHVEYVRRAGS